MTTRYRKTGGNQTTKKFAAALALAKPEFEWLSKRRVCFDMMLAIKPATTMNPGGILMKQFGLCLMAAATLYAVTPGGARADDAMRVTPDRLKWAPVPVIPGGQLAVVRGDPAKMGLFVIEVQWPEGSKIGPHWHSNTERVTILSGTGTIGMGDAVEPEKGMPMPTGTYAEMPGKMHHWFAARTPVVMLIEGDGPFDVNFVHPEDDPTKKAASKQ